MSKTVILHTINSLDIGGAELLLCDTINELKEYDHVVCYLNKPDKLLYALSNIPVYNLNHHSWQNSFRTIYRLKRIIKKHDIQIIHSHLFQTILLTRFAAPKNVKFFFTLHNILSKDAFEVNKLSRIAESLTYKPKQHIISVSKAALKDYDEWIGVKGKADVLYNFIQNKYFELHYDFLKKIDGVFKIIAVGNLRRQKNYYNLLQAFSLLKDQPISLDIYGSGNLKDELEEIIKEKNLNVRLMGRVQDVSKVLPEYNAYIMASLFEGFGIAPMEAMATGMPVLLSDIDVFQEIGEDVPTYFNPEDPASIANAIKKLINNWDTSIEKAKKGKTIIYNKASPKVYFKKLKEIYSVE